VPKIESESESGTSSADVSSEVELDINLTEKRHEQFIINAADDSYSSDDELPTVTNTSGDELVEKVGSALKSSKDLLQKIAAFRGGSSASAGVEPVQIDIDFNNQGQKNTNSWARRVHETVKVEVTRVLMPRAEAMRLVNQGATESTEETERGQRRTEIRHRILVDGW